MIRARATVENPCPICGREKWCMLVEGGIVCTKKKSARPYGNSGGWLHLTRGSGTRRRRSVERKFKTDPGWSEFHARLIRDATDNRIDQLAVQLNVTHVSLRLMAIGWSRERSAYSFPIRKPDGSICGIQYRTVTGDKFVHTGSDVRGLFIPTAAIQHHTLYAPEGVFGCVLSTVDRGGSGWSILKEH